MSSVEKVSIALSPELLAMVKEAVASGDYASTSEVVREALRDWRLRQELREAQLRRLREAWQEGIESGASAALDIDEVKRSARERLAGASNNSSDG